MKVLQQSGFIGVLLLIVNIYPGSPLYCSQCTTEDTPDCRTHPPSPTECPSEDRYCLIVKEYKPSLIDDADANFDDTAGNMILMTRTCVEENFGDFCSNGVKDGAAVTVCRQHCANDGCNKASVCSTPAIITNMIAIVSISLGYFLWK